MQTCVVVVNADPGLADLFWLTKDYLTSFRNLIPASLRMPGAWRAMLEGALGAVTIQSFPAPHDCRDGFYHAYWRRPDAYLSADIRANISVFHRLDPRNVQDDIQHLRRDLVSGVWAQANARLLKHTELDVGRRIAVAELSAET